MCNWNLLPQILSFASDPGFLAIFEYITLHCLMSTRVALLFRGKIWGVFFFESLVGFLQNEKKKKKK